MYENVCAEFGWEMDPDRVAAMKEHNVAALEALAARLKDAEENLGESEVKDALVARADFYSRVRSRSGLLHLYLPHERAT